MMPIKIAPPVSRSNSLPSLKSSPTNLAPSKSTNSTVFVAKSNAKARQRVINDVVTFINKDLFNFAKNYISDSSSMLTIEDLLFVKKYLLERPSSKNTGEKVLEWIKYYAGHQSKAHTNAIDLGHLQEALDIQIKDKIQKSNNMVAHEFAKTNALGISKAEYSTAFALWLKGKDSREEQINLFQWRKFIAGCHRVKELNTRALKSQEPLIEFQGLHPITTDLFMEITTAMQKSAALLAEPVHYAQMNGLITTCIDRVAPDPSSDVDSYISLHEPQEGAVSRIVYNVSDFAQKIFNGPQDGRNWYLKLIKHGSQWHMRGQSTALNPSSILQSFEWQRNEDQSLTRKIAMTTYLNPEVKNQDILLDINRILNPHMTPTKEATALRLLQKMANNPADRCEETFDHWLNDSTSIGPHDDELKELLQQDQDIANNLKAEFMTFLATSREVHANFVFALSLPSRPKGYMQ